MSYSLGKTATFFLRDKSGKDTPIDPEVGIKAKPGTGTDLIVIDDHKQRIPFDDVLLAALVERRTNNSDGAVKDMLGD